jgi:hypothetical protein
VQQLFAQAELTEQVASVKEQPAGKHRPNDSVNIAKIPSMAAKMIFLIGDLVVISDKKIVSFMNINFKKSNFG